MHTTLVINPKGGAGKTTVAINLASYFAAKQVPTTLMDFDPQGSSLHWLRYRPPHAPPIFAANGSPERRDRLRSFDSFVPPQTRQLVIDAPAGASGVLLHDMLDRANCVIVPVVPSPIDIHATWNFVKQLQHSRRIREGTSRVAIVANKVRRSMPRYQPLEHFLQSVNLPLLARLIDSDVYFKAAESGFGVFEMEENISISERKQFAPIVEWVEDRQPPQVTSHDGVIYEFVRSRSA